LKALLKRNALQRCLLSVLFERLHLHDSDFSVTCAANLIFREQMHQAACLSGIKVAKPYRIRAGHRPVNWRGRRLVLCERLSHLLNADRQFTDLLRVHGPKLIDIMHIEARISESALPQLVKLMTFVKMLDRLLKANSD
jgi:hypothetical protein